MSLKSINPYTNRTIEEFEEYSERKLGELLNHSGDAFEKWKRTEFRYRKSLMNKVSRLLIKNKIEYAESVTAEMGKPISESKTEVEKCAWVCDYYAKNTEIFLREEPVETDADMSFVNYEPLGTILGIMPWNFPFWQVFRFAVPTLMAGNTVLLKHASNVQICARHIENIFTGAGFPSSVFINLVIGSDRVEKIIENEIVKAVSITGSEFAGQKVAEIAGRNSKKTLLELGGSNAFVILADADMEKAVEIGIKARMQNAGQSCIAAKRFIVHEKVSEKFIALFKEKLEILHPGDPTKEETKLGPLATIQQAETVEKQVKVSVDMGAKVIAGGIRENAFFQPTLLTGVRPGMPVFDEEVFGPVAPVIIAKDTAEAVALANHTKFGLGVSIFTNDLKKARDLVHEFNDGAVFINALVKSDPRLPFGGTKHSGYGRELSVHGIREFVNIKTVYIKKF
ncbi:MAG: NAD-dependent succinate-semialdehyde dehydrogenase [Bacteroidetes bacterium]|nr:MAG: NAD-dependent succinate-semialdehyde dehydrogenase [Bacteroidota bacterium]